MGHRITLRDVATAANVSVTTASLILNGRPARVSTETRQRIIEVANQLNYVPNQNARSLVTKKSMLIALIVPDIENLFFASLSKQIEDCCDKDGYSLIVANSDDCRANEHDLMGRLSSLGIDGMFLITARESYDEVEALREDVDKMSCPVMLIDRLFAEQWCDGAGLDNYSGGRLAAQCLLDAGHTSIGCIAGDDKLGNATDRVRGFLSELRDRNVPFDPAMKVVGHYRFRGGYEFSDTLIDGGVTAVFCCNDLMAAGFIQRCVERGLSVPEDISVIGYDNILERYGLFQDVTTVEQDVDELAQKCWNHLHQRIEEQGQKAKEKSSARFVMDALNSEGNENDSSAEQRANPVKAFQTAQADKPWLTDAKTILLEPHLVVRSTVAEV